MLANPAALEEMLHSLLKTYPPFQPARLGEDVTSHPNATTSNVSPSAGLPSPYPSGRRALYPSPLPSPRPPWLYQASRPAGQPFHAPVPGIPTLFGVRFYARKRSITIVIWNTSTEVLEYGCLVRNRKVPRRYRLEGGFR